MSYEKVLSDLNELIRDLEESYFKEDKKFITLNTKGLLDLLTKVQLLTEYAEDMEIYK